MSQKPFYIRFFMLLATSLATILYCHGTSINDLAVDNEKHALVAPKGKRYQWYKNGKILKDQTKESLYVEESGSFSVEVSNDKGAVEIHEADVLVTESGRIIKIYLIGDSTVSDYAPSAYPLTGWGQVLPHFFNSNVSFSNRAVPGSSTRTYFQKGYWNNVVSVLMPNDFVFIQFGHNDRDTLADRHTPIADYKRYLAMYINEARQKSALPILVTPMVKNIWQEGILRNVFTEPGTDYRGAMVKVADSLNVPYVDLNMKSWNLFKNMNFNYLRRFIFNTLLRNEYPNYPSGNSDNTHFQTTGAIENARLIVEGLRELKSNNIIQSNLVSNLVPIYQVSISSDLAGADSMVSRNASYPAGIEVTIKTVPKKRYSFLNWNTSQSRCVTTEQKHIFTMGNRAVSFSTNYKGVSVLNYKGVHYAYYRNTSGTPWTKLPNFNLLNAQASGYTSKFDLINMPAGSQAGMVFDAFVYIPTSETYTFYLSSADGSQLFVDNFLVVDNDGTHTTLEKSSTVSLTKGYVKVRVLYFNGTNPRSLKVSYSAPSVTKAEIPASACFSSTTGCRKDSVILVSEKSTSYLWSTGSSQRFIITKRDSSYTLRTQRENGCVVNETIPVVFSPKVTLQTSSSPVTCTTEPITVLSNVTGNPPYSYQWFRDNSLIKGANAASYSATNSGNYCVNVTDNCGLFSGRICKKIDYVITPDVVISAEENVVCQKNSWVNTSIQIKNAVGTYYKLNVTGADTFETIITEVPYLLELTKPGTYNFIVRDYKVNNKCFSPETLTLNPLNNPTVSVNPSSVTVCTNSSTKLTGGNPTGGQWTGPGVSKIDNEYYFTSSLSGSYEVVYNYTTSNGCFSVAKRTITAQSCSASQSARISDSEVITFAQETLGNNVPNPARDETVIPFYLSHQYNEAILEIRSLTSNSTVETVKLNAAFGPGEIKLNLQQLPLGIYSYTLIADGKRLAAKKMIIVK